jgi:tetratricopeptide (TPR) repeat protein
VLAKEMARGRIAKNKETLELLSSAWTSSYEYPAALEVMAELGDLTGDPKYAIESAKLYNELGRWQDVIDSATVALERNYEKPGEANLLIGTAYSELNQLGQALRAFERAADVGDQDQRRNARSWIAFVQDRMKVAEGSSKASG